MNSSNTKLASHKSRLLTSSLTLATAIAMLAPAGAAYAQQSSSGNQPESDASAEQDEGDAAIIVTGSRVATPGLTAPTPVTSVTSEDLSRRAPSNISDALNTLPQFQNSLSNSQSRTFSAASTQTVQGNFLNLRGLGVNRSLILFDGTRLPPTDASGGVDTNTIPQMLIDRVDVVTGGASAAYGSDAVVGAVNFILNKKFTGVRAIAQGGISSRGDDQSYRLGLAVGTSFAQGRGHVMASAERYEIDGLRMYDRANGDRQYLAAGTGSAALPYRTITDSRFATLAFGGLITSGPLAGQQFLPDGSLAPFRRGTPSATTNIDIGGDGAYHGNNTLNSPLETNQFFARASFELSPAISIYAQGSFANSTTEFDAANISLPGSITTIFADNAFLSPAVRAALGATPSFALGTLRRDIPANHNRVKSESVYLKAGAEGSLGGSWEWDANYSHGTSTARQSSRELRYRNFYAGLDAVRDPNGQIVCRVTLTNPGLYPGCVPINLFGEGNVSQAAIDWLRDDSRNTTRDTLDSVSANIRGNLFSTWAGPVAIAVGAEWRRQTLEQTSNANPAIPEDFTGIRGVPANSLRFTRLNAGVSSGSVKVKEAYAEAVVPLIRDSFVDAFDLNGAVRITDYSTSGQVVTWKAGASLEPVSGIRLRGTISRDIAAPTLFQLFAGARVSPSSIVQPDPHTGTSGQYQIITSGNPNLLPEEGKTYTVGAVFQPRFAPGLSLSVDYYHVRINGAIDTPAHAAIVRECEAGNGMTQACSLINRPLPFSDRTAANFPISVTAAPLNIASLVKEGVDIDLSYRTALSRINADWRGNFAVRAIASYSPKFDRTADSLTPTESYAGGVNGTPTSSGFAYPKLTGSIEAVYSDERLTISVTERFTGSYRLDNLYFTNENPKVHNIGYTDLSIAYRLGAKRNIEAFLNVQNLFDVAPPLIPDSGNAGLAFPTNKAIFDVVGTYFTSGVRVRF